jgi:hypothetical protein
MGRKGKGGGGGEDMEGQDLRPAGGTGSGAAVGQRLPGRYPSERRPSPSAHEEPLRRGLPGSPGKRRILNPACWPAPRRALSSPMDRRHYPTRKTGLDNHTREPGVQDLTASERMAMVWTLTLQAWAFAEDLRDEPRLRRDVGRVIRRGR